MSPKFLLLTLTFLKLCFSKDIKDMSVPELIQLAEDVTQLQPSYFTEGDVSFFLFTRMESNKQIYFNSSSDSIDPTKKTKVIIHGWLENHLQSWYKKITDEYLKKSDFNVIQVDWSKIARTIYVSSAENTKFVGDDIATLLISQKIPPENIHIIGHSLGAHAAAFAGKKYQKETGKKIARITALDAAGPYFREFFIDDNHKLSKNDAEIVDAIHTDGGVYGYEQPIGTLDVFMNGGKGLQPDCVQFKVVPLGEAVENSFCSHTSSYHYFIDMINEKKFTCVKCESWQDYREGRCEKKEKYVLDAENIDKTMTGSCYVKTNSKNVPTRLDSLFDISSIARLFNVNA